MKWFHQGSPSLSPVPQGPGLSLRAAVVEVKARGASLGRARTGARGSPRVSADSSWTSGLHARPRLLLPPVLSPSRPTFHEETAHKDDRCADSPVNPNLSTYPPPSNLLLGGKPACCPRGHLLGWGHLPGQGVTCLGLMPPQVPRVKG